MFYSSLSHLIVNWTIKGFGWTKLANLRRQIWLGGVKFISPAHAALKNGRLPMYKFRKTSDLYWIWQTSGTLSFEPWRWIKQRPHSRLLISFIKSPLLSQGEMQMKEPEDLRLSCRESSLIIFFTISTFDNLLFPLHESWYIICR